MASGRGPAITAEQSRPGHPRVQPQGFHTGVLRDAGPHNARYLDIITMLLAHATGPGPTFPCRIGFLRQRDEEADTGYLLGVLVRPGDFDGPPCPKVHGMIVWSDGRFMPPQPAATPELAMELAEAVGWAA